MSFEARWPQLWSLLNQRARRKLPDGVAHYLSGPWKKCGEAQFDRANVEVWDLIATLSYGPVRAAYGRDLSNITSERQLAELLCEISVCRSFSRMSTGMKLRPEIDGQLRRPDFLAVISKYRLYGEVKRYEDSGPGPSGRSIARAELGGPGAKRSTARPRMMDLIAKLLGVPDQFPEGNLTLLCVFHSSIGESHRYLQQALYGDEAFFADPCTATVTRNDALFALERWRKVSAVALLGHDGAVRCRELWQNPNAAIKLPDALDTVIRQLANI